MGTPGTGLISSTSMTSKLAAYDETEITDLGR